MDDQNEQATPNLDASESGGQPPQTLTQPTQQPASQEDGAIVTKVRAINPLTAMFGIIIIIALVVIVFVTLQEDETPTFNATELSDTDRAKLLNEGSEIEPNGEILTISPNAEFKNNVEVEKSLEIVGDLTVLGQINWSNSSGGGGDGSVGSGELLQSAQITGDFTVGGNSQFDGVITANGGLNVNGETNLSSLIASSATVNGDLRINRHLVSGGGSVSGSSGGAVGSGGTINVSGDDVAGTVRVNTGGSAPAGRLVTVNFRSNYGGTPTIMITPVGSGSAAVDYYVERNTSSFSIYSLSDTPDNTQLQFDYLVIQ
jgi:hypothetical protein